MADAPDLGSGGQPWGFKSLLPHQTFFKNKSERWKVYGNEVPVFDFHFSFLCSFCKSQMEKGE